MLDIREEISQFVENNFIDEKWYELYHPADIAEALEELEPEILHSFVALMDLENLARIIELADEDLQLEIINKLSLEDAIEIFSYMSTDNTIDILGNLSIDKRKSLLKEMKQGEANELRKLLGYDAESAGGIMTTEYIILKEELSKKEALTKIAEIGPRTEIIDIIYINNNKDELVGTVDLRELLNVSDEISLAEIMDENLIAVTPDVDQEEVAFLVAKYDLTAIPVINQNNKMIGIITVDDIIDVIEAENTEDMLRLAGVHEEENINSPLGKSVTRRLPWLAVDLGMTFLSAFIVSLFEDVIAQAVVLASVLPIIANMGGNAGNQSLSVMIRGIALGDLDLDSENGKILLKEGLLGLINGAAIGLFAATVMYFIHGNPYLGLIIFLSLTLNLFIAGLLGFLIPMVLKWMGFDPALGSSIFLTTFLDIVGFFVFLSLARIFINLLL